MKLGSRKIKRLRNIHEALPDALAQDNFTLRHGEGRITSSINKYSLFFLFFLFFVGMLLLLSRVAYLQIVEGKTYNYISENNTFAEEIVFAKRGTIYDRYGEKLAWDVFNETELWQTRQYVGEGFSSLLGFVNYPMKDDTGNYFRTTSNGVSNLEEFYNSTLRGINGRLVLEKNAIGDIIARRFVDQTINGSDISITVDATVQKALYTSLQNVAKERGYEGATGALMNIRNGELIALVSYPDYNSNILANGSDDERKKYLESDDAIFTHRAVSGLYTPGSTVKPFFAVAAIEENIVPPTKTLVSNGAITLVNLYDPDIIYTFKDWRAHGKIDLYDAIAWSSNVYFYHIGGGYAAIEGLGIDRIKKYAELFRLHLPTQLQFTTEPEGIIPHPAWKQEAFEDEWRVGDTYNTVIGQYGFQVTPLQLLRGFGVIANDGVFIEPHLTVNEKNVERYRTILSQKSIDVAKKGMRLAVTEGTAKPLNTFDVQFAAKTGTAQIDTKGLTNSLIAGFFPYEKPKYAFVIIMERGKQNAANSAATTFFNTLLEVAPKYLEP